MEQDPFGQAVLIDFLHLPQRVMHKVRWIGWNQMDGAYITIMDQKTEEKS